MPWWLCVSTFSYKPAKPWPPIGSFSVYWDWAQPTLFFSAFDSTDAWSHLCALDTLRTNGRKALPQFEVDSLPRFNEFYPNRIDGSSKGNRSHRIESVWWGRSGGRQNAQEASPNVVYSVILQSICLSILFYSRTGPLSARSLGILLVVCRGLDRGKNHFGLVRAAFWILRGTKSALEGVCLFHQLTIAPVCTSNWPHS